MSDSQVRIAELQQQVLQLQIQLNEERQKANLDHIRLRHNALTAVLKLQSFALDLLILLPVEQQLEAFTSFTSVLEAATAALDATDVVE